MSELVAHFGDEVERRRRLIERLRAEFIAGAEEEWRKWTGRPMTTEGATASPGRHELESLGRCSPSRPRRREAQLA